jgi:hypothetical protein
MDYVIFSRFRGGYMENFGVPNISKDVFDVLSLLLPYEIDVAKKRVGPERDGGYVVSEYSGTPDLVSFGISNDVRFEKALGDQGHRCFMYDHTIAQLPEHHDSFNWFKIGVSGSYDETDELLSISSHLNRIDHSDRMILKIDVEGAEWDVFSTIDRDDLVRFEQIVGEFHWFMELDNPSFREKVYRSLRNITNEFTLFHVHANNCRPLGFAGGFAVADVLELSFVRNDLVRRSPSSQVWPSPLDKANNEIVTDHALLFYPFLPNASQGDTMAVIAHIESNLRY